MTADEKLQKFLARAGVASRRKAEGLIVAGAVTVNGRVATLGQRVQPTDDVRVQGQRVSLSAKRTFMLYKPVGVLSSASDDRGRQTVLDLLPVVPGLHPVGRLDLDSEGLLLLSTDGELTLHLTHPRYEHDKEYRVWTDTALEEADVQALIAGVRLEDGLARAHQAASCEGGCKIVLREGRKRQVRRMLAALGLRVTRLKRTRVAHLDLGNLQPGQWRELSEAELRPLRREASS